MDTYKHDSRLQSSGALLLPKTGRIICKKKGGKERDAVVNDSKQILNCSLGRLYSSPLFTETWHCVCQHSWRPALSLSKTLVTTTMTRTWCIYNTHIYIKIYCFFFIYTTNNKGIKNKRRRKKRDNTCGAVCGNESARSVDAFLLLLFPSSLLFTYQTSNYSVHVSARASLDPVTS